jgi:hypothetical protein
MSRGNAQRLASSKSPVLLVIMKCGGGGAGQGAPASSAVWAVFLGASRHKNGDPPPPQAAQCRIGTRVKNTVI